MVPLGGIGEGKRVTQTVTDDGGSNTLNLVAGTALGLGLLSILVSTYGLTKDAGQLLLGLLGQPQTTTTPISEAEQAQMDHHLELRRILGGLNDGYFDPSWADLSSDELQIKINDMLGDNAVENAPIESVVPGSDHIAYPRQFVESLQRRFHEATLGPADPGRALTAFTMTFLFVASIFVEPIDWAVTAVSVAECAAAEDWECVGTEMALVFLPGAVGALGDAGRNVNKIEEIVDVGDEVADEVVDVFDDTTGANNINDRTVDPGGGGGNLSNTELIQSVVDNGHKISPEEVVGIVHNPSIAEHIPNVDTVWLESGNKSAGLQHILDGHSDDFLRTIGTSDSELVTDFIMDTVENNVPFSSRHVVKPNGRLEYTVIYEVVVETGSKYLELGIGDNGFIVTAFIARNLR